MSTQENIASRQRGEITTRLRKARVVANYGDLGLTEAKYFDILSRFIIVMFEPSNRTVIPTDRNISKLFGIVRRPRELWVDVDGGVQSNITNQMRSDYQGNVNKGDPSSYSINNIPPIDNPYALGEEIVVRQLESPLYFSSSLFDSEFDSSHFNYEDSKYVESYLTRDPSGAESVSAVAAHWESSRIYPLYPAGGTTRPAAIRGTVYTGDSIAGFLNASLSYKTKANQGNPKSASLEPYSVANHYGIGLNKFPFELFWRYTTQNLSTVDSVIAGNFTVGSNYSDSYYWSDTSVYSNSTLLMRACFYEDTNINNKKRVPSNECLPLIVTQPNTFPIPRTRQAGSIKFDPTFAQIVS